MTHLETTPSSGRPGLARIIGLILVPLVIAGVFLWGLWSPTDRLDRVTAAVVNHDEPVEVDGQVTPLGRLLAAELIDGSADQNFTWQLTDESDAAAGLEDGRYVTVVTIPENFSNAATSLSRGPDAAEQATIDIKMSERSKLLDPALGTAVTQTATALLNEQLGSMFVGSIFVGMSEIGDGLSNARDGATQLADGASQLADGLGELGHGTEELAVGTQQLADGASQLADGAQLSAEGAAGLAQGLGEYALGVGDFASGMHGFTGGADELAAGARAAADGSAELAQGVTEYTGMVNQVLVPVNDSLAEAVPYLEMLRDEIISGAFPIDDAQREQVLAAIDEILAAPGMLGQAIEGGRQLADGAAQSAAGSAQLADGVQQLASGAHGLAEGADDLADGASGLARGAGELAGGFGELSRGVGDLGTGTRELAEQTPTLVDGISQLADGAGELAGGSTELADGLGTAADEVPRYSESEREKLAETAVTPVASDRGAGELFNGSGSPLFTSVALWAGAFATFLLCAPLWSRTRVAAQSEARITLRSALPSILIGAAQGLLVGLIMGVVQSLSLLAVTGFMLLGGLAGVAFSLINQGLVALLGGYGRFLAFLLLVVAFVAGIISTAPGVLQVTGGISPIGSAIDGFQAIATGESGAGIAGFVLVLWGALGLGLVGLAVRRARRTLPEAV